MLGGHRKKARHYEHANKREGPGVEKPAWRAAGAGQRGSEWCKVQNVTNMKSCSCVRARKFVEDSEAGQALTTLPQAALSNQQTRLGPPYCGNSKQLPFQEARRVLSLTIHCMAREGMSEPYRP